MAAQAAIDAADAILGALSPTPSSDQSVRAGNASNRALIPFMTCTKTFNTAQTFAMYDKLSKYMELYMQVRRDMHVSNVPHVERMSDDLEHAQHLKKNIVENMGVIAVIRYTYAFYQSIQSQLLNVEAPYVFVKPTPEERRAGIADILHTMTFFRCGATCSEMTQACRTWYQEVMWWQHFVLDPEWQQRIKKHEHKLPVDKYIRLLLVLLAEYIMLTERYLL